jgi:hypothetical protein
MDGMRTRAGWNLSLLAACAVSQLAASCVRESYTEADERSVREQLGLPPDVELLRIAGEPSDPGLWQREGLRIFAKFRLSAAQRGPYFARLAASYRRLPVPGCVAAFRDPPPAAMLGASRGAYLCKAHVFAPNSNAVQDTWDCCARDARPDGYILATYDDATGVLSAWSKSYY